MSDKSQTTADRNTSNKNAPENGEASFYYVPKDKRERRDWCKRYMDRIDNYSVNQYTISMRLKYEEYFNIFRGVFDVNQYQYVWGGNGGLKPMRFDRLYPLVTPLINSVVGKFMLQDNNDSFPFNAYKVNPDAASKKSKMEAELLLLKMVKPIWDKVEQKTGAKLNLDPRADMLPDDIKSYMKYNIRDAQEETVYNGIKYIIPKHDLKSVFSDSLYNECIAGVMFGKIEYCDGDAVVVSKDPRKIITDIGIDNYAAFKPLNQGWQFCAEENYYPINQVLYKYEYWLTDTQKDDLKKIVQMYNRDGNTDNWVNRKTGIVYCKADSTGVNVRVVDAQWLARNTREFPKDYNEVTGEVKNSELDIMDVYEGVKIGHGIYCKMQRKKNILRSKDNYRQAQLDYFGIISKYSLYDTLMPLQMLYQIVMTYFDFATSQAGGTAIEYDANEFPNIDGMDWKLDDVMYNAKAGGVILKQKKEGLPDNGQKSSVGRQVDFGVSNSIINLFKLKAMIEQTASRMTGISPDQLGFGNPYQSEGVQENNLQNSGSAMQPIYYVHSKFIEMGLQKMADLLKVVWDKEEVRTYPLGDMGMAMLNIDSELSLSDYGIFMQNNMKNAQDKDFIMKLLAPGVSVDPTLGLEMMKIQFAGSQAEMVRIYKEAVDSIRQLNMMRAQSGQQVAQGAQQVKQADIQQKGDIAKNKAQTDFAGKKYTADAGVKKSMIDKEGRENVQELKNKGGLSHQQLKDFNADSMQESQHHNNILEQGTQQDDSGQPDNEPTQNQ